MQTVTIKREIESAVVFALGKNPASIRLSEIKDWRGVIDFMLNCKLAGIFYRRLQDEAQLSLVPEDQAERLRQFYYFVALKNKVLLTELKKIWAAFSEKDVPMVLLKGTSLILTGVYQMGERYSADLDFLVDKISRGDLKAIVNKAGYAPVEHSDKRWWTEEHFIRSGGKLLDEMFSIFLEFHWTFRPLNKGNGREMAESIFQNCAVTDYHGGKYTIPTPDLQFYQAGIHGSAYHAFDSAYFWVSLADLSALSRRANLNYAAIADMAESQGMLEHLGVMGWIMSEKLGLDCGLWKSAVGKMPYIKPVLEKTGQAVWMGFLSTRAVSFTNLVYFLGKSGLKNRVRAFLELAGLASGERVEAQGVRMNYPRSGFFALLSLRLKKIDREFLSLVWQMARFYRTIKFQIPEDS
jgi:hypothetical protein